MVPEFSQLLDDRKPWIVSVYDEKINTGPSLGRIGIGRNGSEVTDRPVRDEGLWTIDAVTVTFPYRSRSNSRGIRSRVRFGQGEGSDLLPRTAGER